MNFSIKAKQRQDDEDKSFSLNGDPEVICVFDGDELAFKIAAACEKNELVYQNKLSSEKVSFKHKTQFKKFMEGVQFDDELFTSELVKTPEPIQNAIKTIKDRIKNICDKCNAGTYEVYLSGKDNFRDFLPLPVLYKGHRKDAVRPVLLKDLRAYLIKYQDAVVVNGREADDALTSRMNDGYESGQVIIGCTQDKDACQTSGHYLHPDKFDEPFFIDGFGDLVIDEMASKKQVRGWGRKFLYWQILIGDKVDHYCPRDLYLAKQAFLGDLEAKKPKFGEIAAYNLLEHCEDDEEALDVVKQTYISWFGEDSFKYETHTGDINEVDYLDAIQLYMDCAYMQRWEGDRVDVRSLYESI